MSPEENKRIVQEYLDKRKKQREAANEEKRQESFTAQMISVVNNKQLKADKQREIEIKNSISEKKRHIRSKKIARLQETRDGAVIGVFMSLIFLAAIGICYATEITMLPDVIAATIFTSIIFIINASLIVGCTMKGNK